MCGPTRGVSWKYRTEGPPTATTTTATVRVLLLVLVFSMCVSNWPCQGFVLDGSPTSYVQYPRWYVGLNGSLEFEFKTDEPNGLLIYTDDGGTFDFFELKLVEGALRLRYNLGGGASILTVGRNLSDHRWHRVQIGRNTRETRLAVDGSEASRPVRLGANTGGAPLATSGSGSASDLHFGNFTTNSYVYVGGIPGWYSTKLQLLALPSAYFEPRFRGSVRNVVFASNPSDGPGGRRQEMMQNKGIRTNKLDTCERQDPCQHGGICISTDEGALCDCRFIDFDGSFCEKGNHTIQRRNLVDVAPSEATFRGNDFLSFDRARDGSSGVEPIVSSTDEISLHFKTKHPNGLLFFTGDGADYLNLALKDGGILLTIALGSGTLEKQVKPLRMRFDDNQWHKVTVHRKVKEISEANSFCHMSMTVDGVYNERGTTAGTFTMLSSSVMYVAGSENTMKLPGSRIQNNFIGCLRKVEFTADSVNLKLIDLARSSNKLINVQGNVRFMCQEVEAADPITFTTKDSYLVLPSWDGSRSGRISFKIRTNEPNGLLMYNSGATTGSGGDFFAFELIDGHVFLLLNLGSGATKIKVTNRRVDDSQWHSITLNRFAKSGRVTVDESAADFITPGESSQLDLTGSLFVGGVGTRLDAIMVPAELWTGALSYGYVGCMRDLVVNGKAIDLAAYAKKQDSGSVRPACHTMPQQCDSQPCMNGGTCSEGWNRFRCDCSTTSFVGSTCGKDATTLSFDGNQHVKITMPEESQTQAEDINLRFHTNRPNGLFVAMTTEQTSDKLEMALDTGRVRLTLNLGDGEKVMKAGHGLNDNQWHTVRVTRRGNFVELRVDEEPPTNGELSGKHTTLDFNQIHVGSITTSSTTTPTTTTTVVGGSPSFVGHMQQFIFNGNSFFDMARSNPSSNLELTAVFGKKEPVVHHAVTFKSKYTSVGLPMLKTYSTMNLYFQFKTLEPNGLVLYNTGKGQDFLAIELVNGHVHFTFNLGDGPRRILSNTRNALNDNRWHAVTVGRPTLSVHTLIVDDMIATVSSPGTNVHLDLDGILHLGGVPKHMYNSLPKVVQSKYGFEGCLASLDLNGDTPDPVRDAIVPNNLVTVGCDGPSTKCNINACANRGVCVQQWNSYSCDCDMTSFTGPTCSEESKAYKFGPDHGLITFNFPMDRKPDTKGDLLALAFVTRKESGILVRIDSSSSNDYLELSLVDGSIVMVYNMGTADHAMQESSVKVNDGEYHVIRVTRSGSDSTIQVDDNNVLTKHPSGKQLIEFNSQSRVQLGGHRHSVKNIIERPLEGIMTGVVLNGIRILDLAYEKDPRTVVEGDVLPVPSISNMSRRPAYDRRGDSSQPHMQQTTAIGGNNMDELVSSGFGCGPVDDEDCSATTDTTSTDDLITPVYTAPTPKPKKTTTTTTTMTSTKRQNKPCDDDDEDCKDDLEGSGAGAGAGSIVTATTPMVMVTRLDIPTIRPDLTMSTTTTTTRRTFDEDDWRPQQPVTPTRGRGSDPDEHYEYPDHGHQTPKPTTHRGGMYVHPDSLPPPPTLPPRTNYPPPRTEHGQSTRFPAQGSSSSAGGTSSDGVALVIGIVAGILSIVVLVILLVCKFCVQSEGSYKVDESKNYQFAGGGGGGRVMSPMTTTTITGAHGSPSLGSGIHSSSYGISGGGCNDGSGFGLGPLSMMDPDGVGIYGPASCVDYINGHQQLQQHQQPPPPMHMLMNGNVKTGDKAPKLPKKKDLKDIKEWYV